MKVLLINPPAKHTLIGNNPPIIDEERGYNPPLGLLYIAAYVKKHTAHTVEVLDAQVEEMNYAKLKEEIAQRKPDITGITTMTFTLLDVLKTVKIIKDIDRNIKVVLGGPHVHLYPNETINLPGIDFLILGEGEATFTELIENISDSRNLKNIKGLVGRCNGELINTGIRNFIDNLDEIPFPSRDLTPYQKYSSLLAKRNPITTMITSRGCPYQCIFCDRPHLGKKFRARSAKNVVDEMEACVRLGIREFLIYDDTFNIDEQRVIDICEGIIRRKLNIGWDIRARVDHISKEMLKRLKEANCERIHYGIEAGTDRILEILKKGITIEQTRKTIKMTKEAGISTLLYFMIGCPTETKEDIQKTLDLAKQLGPDFVHITVLTPFPGTQLYRNGLQQGILKHDFWQEFAQNPNFKFKPLYWEENFTSRELRDLIRQAYKGFYSRPKYIFRELTKVKSLGELARKVKAGWKVLRM